MPADSDIAQIRAFNRFYTRQIGLLEEHFADGPLSLPEARVLYEIDARGQSTAGDLASTLRMDRGYLSRMLQRFTTEGLVAPAPNPADGRSSLLTPTANGRDVAAGLNDRSDAAIAQLVGHLDAGQRHALVEAMGTLRRLLGDESLSAGPVRLRGHRLGELGWLIHRQALVYNAQFGWNADFEALIAGIYSQFQQAPETPPKDLWVADQNGAIAGSVFVMPSDGLPGSAQLRMLYVEPASRGQGIGTTLVAQAVGFARDGGYERIRLWTHANQESARKLYAAAGFVIVETMPEHNFGHELLGEIWQLQF